VRRREVICSIAAAFALDARSRAAAQSARPRKVGVIASEAHLTDAVVTGLREFGWDPRGDVEVLRVGTGTLADIDQLLRLKPEVLVAGGEVRIAYAAEHAPRTPIIAIDLEGDPERSGLVQSLSRPGGNITGIWLDMPEMAGKLVELVKEVVPEVSRCAILSDERFGRAQVEATERAAESAGLQVERLVIDDLRGAEQLVAHTAAGALIVLTSPSIFVQRGRIAAAAGARRIASISIFPDYARAGGLMGYGPSLTGMFRRSARYVDAVLRGRPPAELPVERPTRFEFVLNQRTADALGLKFPLRLLAGADEVIE
jgi:putative tryptophan/tyrosine transport system substrate-binding protein